MNERDDELELLREIRDQQRRSLELQQQLLDLARSDAEQRREQIRQSLDLQRDALGRQRQIMRLGVPLIALCLVLIAYLVIRYF